MQHLYLPSVPTVAAPLGRFRFTLKAVALLTAVVSIACAGRAAVDTAPMFTSPSTVTFPQGIYSSFTITTSGDPIPSITQTGHLPGGVKFIDNDDGTATLSGRPGNGKGLIGDYALTLTASNGVIPAAVQNFTLTISSPPRIVSVNNTTFVVGMANTFTVATLSTVPKSTLSVTGILPTGVTFKVNNNGTATLSGNPAAGTEGVYKITLTAQNGTLPNATQLFTLTVQDAVPIYRAPTITSAATTTFTTAIEGTFTVQTSALPTASLSLSGTLPEWLTFIDNTDGTATLLGAPDLGGAASYTFTITAANGVAPDAVQTFTLLVLNASPAITSVNNATFVVGTFNSFIVKTRATSPVSVLSFSGALPSGVSFVSNLNGTATLSGTPAGGSEGAYPLMITAANGTLPDAIQNFTLTVQATPPVLHAPAITSATASTFTVGIPGTITVTTTGTPTPQVTPIGAQPSWLSYVDHTDGSATFSGTPDSGSDASYSFTITAANGVLPNATQTFVLTVTQAPTFTSPSSATFQIGVPGSFIIETRGNPIASLTKTGTLPGGVSFIDDGDGTATVTGTPTAGSSGDYLLTITAANGVMPNAKQTFTLTIASSSTPTPTPTPTPSPTPTRLLNISTRLLTKTGDNVAIGGFIIGGNAAKTVLIRGLGPSLAAFLPNALQDPTLELHQGSAVIVSNDDWQDTPNVGQIPPGFEPADPRDSVIVATLLPGPYTVIQAAKDAAGGIGLLEVYDLDSAGDAILANISTRGLVQTGDDVMIGGFILGGGAEGSTVVIRAIGPSLTSFGIGNPLADPTLELHDANGASILANDNWRDDAAQGDELIATGFAPDDDVESAIIATLPPAGYTAIVAGKDGTGIALIEIYKLQ